MNIAIFLAENVLIYHFESVAFWLDKQLGAILSISKISKLNVLIVYKMQIIGLFM